MNKISFYSVSAQEREQLKKLTPKLKADYHSAKLSLKNLPNAATEVISIHVDCKITKEFFDKLPNLKLVVTRTAGSDHIDIAAATKAGVKIANCPGMNAISVAEFAFGLILHSYRDFGKALAAGKKLNFHGQDAELFGHELRGKTLGIVGTGAIGGYVARIAKGFGMNLLGFDAFKNKDLAKETGLKYVPLAQLVKKSDVVTFHVPAIPSTNKMVSGKLLAGFKTGALLVNTARGAVVDTSAVLKALQSGKLGGYAADVLELEADPKTASRFTPAQKKIWAIQKKLANQSNVLLTPHTAHATIDSDDRIFTHTFELISAFQKGQKISSLN